MFEEHIYQSFWWDFYNYLYTETEVGGGPIYKGNPNSSNADGATQPLTAPDEVKIQPNKEEEEKKPPSGGSSRKEKSVLQAKLTKLAIQIGYAGT